MGRGCGREFCTRPRERGMIATRTCRSSSPETVPRPCRATTTSGRRSRPSAPPGRRPGAPRCRPGVDPLRALRRARPRLRARDRLHGRRFRHRAGGAGLLRRGHAARAGGPRADPLPPAPSPHDALRDVRAQAAHQGADLRRPAMAPPPHRERKRVFRALLQARPRILRARPGPSPVGPGRAGRPPAGQQQRHGRPVRVAAGGGDTSGAGRAVRRQQAGPGRCDLDGLGGPPGALAPRLDLDPRLRRLREPAQREREMARRRTPTVPASPASSRARRCRSTTTRSSTGRSTCTTCCTSCRCGPTPTPSTRSAPMPT